MSNIINLVGAFVLNHHSRLAVPDACDRDIQYLKELNVNAVRVYSVDAKADHSHCMRTLSDAGIYAL